MIAKRVLGAAGAGILLGSLGALAACSGNSDGTAGAQETLQSANVALTVFDANGNQVQTGSGVLIAPQLVLTAAHLVAGNAKWSITTADGKSHVMGHKALTKDWMDYDSIMSHPRKTDVAVIYLDHPIRLAAYPKLAATRQADGTAITRVSHQGQAFNFIQGSLSHFQTFSHAYNTEIPTSETLDTGGAVANDKGEVIGVVTGRGMQTGKLHIARIDELLSWMSPKLACAGGSALAVPSSLGVRTYGTPPPSTDTTCDGGAGSGTSSSGGSSSGGSSGSSGSSGGGASSGGPGASSGGPGGDCDDGGGTTWGDGGGGGSSSSGGLSSGNVGSSSGGSSGSSGAGSTSSSGGSSSGGSSGSSGAGSTSSSGGLSSGNVGSSSGGSSGSSGAGSSGSSGGSSGSSGAGGASSSGGLSSGSVGSSSGGSSGSSGAGGSAGGDQCQGSSDNPDVCPPEPEGCAGPGCGGGTPDSTVDYGASGGSGGSSGGPAVIH